MNPIPYPSGGWSDAGFQPRVWAPEAKRVDLVVDDRPEQDGLTSREAMIGTDDGWWQAERRLSAGARYAFSVDGGDPRPDPRSAWQPDGVHAMSAVHDPGAHDWADAEWVGRDVRGAVIYELHVGTFTHDGTLDGAIERLDHLVELGVDMVELMPLAAFPGQHGWGYDGVALFAVHRAYGGPAALQRFVDAAHRRGLAVCLDVVYNHLGPSGNYLGVYGPYFTETHQTPWGAAVNLDADNAEGMRAFIIDNACRWFESFHIDALRLDAVHALQDDSEQHILAELSLAVDALSTRLGRPLSLIAESDLNDARMVTPVADGGLGMHAQWADDVHHAIRAWSTGERQGWLVDFGSTEALAKVMRSVFEHDGTFSTFRDRHWGAPVPRDTDARRFVAFGTTHDQVGNRAVGDRPSALLNPDQLAAMHALVLFSPFTPMLFMGEEWGATTPWQFFTDHQEPELAQAVRDGRRREFADALSDPDAEVPDPQSSQTFERSRLDWSEPDRPDHARQLDWVKRLIALRRDEPAMSDASLDTLQFERGEDDAWIALQRHDLRLVIARQESTVDIGEAELLLGWGTLQEEMQAGPLRMAPGTIAVLRTSAFVGT